MPIHDWTRVIPGTFHHFHHNWISALSVALNTGVLPSNFYAMAEQIAGGLGPDVLTLESMEPLEDDDGQAELSATDVVGTALATAAHVRATLNPKSEMILSARRRKRIAIRHRSGDRVVAMIEIVSPGNKSDRHSFSAFVEKALELLEAGIHLLIIDLFPTTPRDPHGIHAAIWEEVCGEEGFQLPKDKPLTLVSYEAGLEIEAYIEPVAVGQSLADMPLFLRPGRHVRVPLESSYQAAFEGVPLRWQKEL